MTSEELEPCPGCTDGKIVIQTFGDGRLIFDHAACDGTGKRPKVRDAGS